MAHKYCNYETSLALKDAGFDQDCVAYWWRKGHSLDRGTIQFNFSAWKGHSIKDCLESHNRSHHGEGMIDAPRIDDAASWLRSKGVWVQPIFAGVTDRGRYSYYCSIDVNPRFDEEEYISKMDCIYTSDSNFETYEDALKDGLLKAAEYLKSKIS